MSDARLLQIIKERGAKADSNTAFSAEQAKALRYYFGEQFGNEAPDRSKIVTREVYSTIEWIKPALMKMFFGSERVVEFRPKGANDVAAAEQETDYINHVITDRNDGFLQFIQWFTDALLMKNGYMLAWWDERTDVTESVYEGLDETTLAILAGEDDVEIIEQEQDTIDELRGDPLYTVRLREKSTKGQVKIKCLKPENVRVYNKHDSVSLKDVTFAMYEEELTISSLREQGFDVDPDDYTSDPEESRTAREVERARMGVGNVTMNDDTDDADPASRMVCVETIFMRVDFDGDGIAELRRVVKCSDKILYNEVDDSVNIASITPTIIAHRHMGMSVADVLTDLQEIKSMLTRGYVDNVALANNGRYFVDDERVNMDDMLISRPGGVVRVEGGVANAAQPFEHPMIGNTVVQAIEYFDNMIENRTGASPRVLQGQSFDGNAINKMLDVHTPVPMADGTYRILADIADGDRLIGADGRPVTVVRAHEVATPKTAYEIRFKSGETIVAGGEHLWTVQTENDKRAGKRRTVSTDWLHDYMQQYAKNVYIDRVQRPMTGTDIELPLDPYVLGVWLGDGHGWAARITTPEPEIHARLERWGKPLGIALIPAKQQNAGAATTYDVSGGLWSTLRDMGLMRRNQDDDYEVIGKRIPAIYFQASYAQRLELLRGLMDTDGCHQARALVIFSQKQGPLLNDAIRLIESLGGWPGISQVDPGDAGRDGETYWNVNFHLFDNPFWVPRKADKWIAPQMNVATQPIVSIETAPLRPMRCLTVDADDGQFCVGRRFTVTHNTATGINAIMSAAMARIELIARIFAETGVQDLYRIVHKLTLKHARKADVFRLRGEYHEVDPRTWDTREDMGVATGLGTGDTQGRIAGLQQMVTAQMTMIEKGTGLANRQTLYNALAKLSQLMGYSDPTMFWVKPDTPEMPPSQPDPQVLIDQKKLEIEAKRRESDAQIRNRQIDADLEKAKIQRDHDEAKTKATLTQQAKMEKLKADEERIKMGIAPDETPTPDELGALMAELQALQAEVIKPKRVVHQYDAEGRIVSSALA